MIKKYSNFVGSPIFLNGQRANDIQPLWLMEPKDVSQEQHNEFYRFIGNTFDTPRFVLHYKVIPSYMEIKVSYKISKQKTINLFAD